MKGSPKSKTVFILGAWDFPGTGKIYFVHKEASKWSDQIGHIKYGSTLLSTAQCLWQILAFRFNSIRFSGFLSLHSPPWQSLLLSSVRAGSVLLFDQIFFWKRVNGSLHQVPKGMLAKTWSINSGSQRWCFEMPVQQSCPAITHALCGSQIT